MAAHAARRLLEMADNTAQILGIELLVAAQGCDFHAPMISSPPLERLRRLIRVEVPHLEDDRILAPEIAKATALVRSGQLVRAVGEAALPVVYFNIGERLGAHPISSCRHSVLPAASRLS